MSQYIMKNESAFSSFIIDIYTVLIYVSVIVYERIEKLLTWWWMNNTFTVKDDYSTQKLLDLFFSWNIYFNGSLNCRIFRSIHILMYH